MHANNEIGNMLDMHAVGNICKKYGAIFHSDTVQTVGHFPFDLRNTPVHFITGAGHKFHGPKGVGLLYINENVGYTPIYMGVPRNEICVQALKICMALLDLQKRWNWPPRATMKKNVHTSGAENVHDGTTCRRHIKGVAFNGDPAGRSLYTVLSVSFPKTEKSEMLLFNLDINNICASGGSACTSGAEQGSHVIRAINNNPNQVTVRFPFAEIIQKKK